MKKCVFFDRDGIVNVPPEEGGYVQCVAEFRTMPAFLDALRVAADNGFCAVIITNQQGVGKGLYTEETLAAIHAKLLRDVKDADQDILAIYHCPHMATEACSCRKPKPGMIMQAAKELDIDLAASWMVGDSFRDIDAGAAAGCHTLLVNPRAYDRATVSIERMDELPATLATIFDRCNLRQA